MPGYEQPRAPVRFGLWLALILVLDAAIVLPLLGRTAIWTIIDEGRIAEVAREMVEGRNWVVPRIGGETYWDYPPLAYWLMAASGTAFGFNEFAMRLPGALAGIALISVVAMTARRLAGDRAGLASAIVLATTPALIDQQSICRADVLLVLTIAVAFDRFLVVAGGDRRARQLAILYLALAAGILAKGPLAVIIPGLGLAVWLAITRRWRVLLDLKPWFGVPALLALVLPWYVAAYHAGGMAFIRQNLLAENVKAFATGNEHPRPVWSYAGWMYRLVPWMLALLLAWRVRRTPGLGLMLGWTGAILLMLAVSSSKRPNYMTFVLPAFAPAVGIAVAGLWKEAPKLLVRGLIAMGALTVAASAVVGVAPIRWKGDVAALTDLLPYVAATGAVAGIAIAAFAWKRGAVAGTIALAVILAAGYVGWRSVLQPRTDDEGRRGVEFCREVVANLPAGETLATSGTEKLEGAYHFHMERAVVRRDGGPGYYIGNEAQFRAFPRDKVKIIDSLLDEKGRPKKHFFMVNP